MIEDARIEGCTFTLQQHSLRPCLTVPLHVQCMMLDGTRLQTEIWLDRR